MKKIFLVALLSFGILFTGSSLFAGSIAGTTAIMKVLIDVESGKILAVYKVYGEKETKVEPIPVGKSSLNGKSIISIPDYTVIRTHSSPDCQTIYFQGYGHQVCS